MALAKPRQTISWAQIWQMPTLVAGLGLLVLGVYLGLPKKESNDFAGALAQVEAMFEANELDQAYQHLAQIAEYIGGEEIKHQAHHAMLMGDQIYLKQYEENWSEPKNYELVIGYYRKAQEWGREMSAVQLQRWADTLISLGREDQAMEMIEKLGQGEIVRQLQLVRKLIDQRVEHRGVRDPDRVAKLLFRYNALLKSHTDIKERREGGIWASAIEARLFLETDQPLRAINGLVIRYQRFVDEGGDDDLAPLMIQFGNAYLRTGDYDDAQRYFLRAMQVLKKEDARNADVLIGLAQVEQLAHNEDHKALAYYQQAVRDYPSTPSYLRALIGQADVEAKIEAHSDAIEHFAEAIELIVRQQLKNDPRRDETTNIILAHYDLNFNRNDFARALDYLSLIRPLYDQSDQMPADLLWRLAVTYERFAQERRADAQKAAQVEAEQQDSVSASARRLANIESAESYAAAARFYLQHARKMTHDDQAHGQSMWRAAQSYDAAQLWDEAVAVYLEFLEQRRTEDPLYLKAVHNLGLAYLAQRDYETARERFKYLIEQYPRSPEAILSLVSLAKCHDRLGEADHAVRVLEHVVTDHPTITAQSVEYREALIELGRIHYKAGEFEPAISRLTEAVTRYGDESEGAQLRFLLADSFRRSAAQLDSEMTKSMTDTELVTRRMQKVERLEEGLKLYGLVIDLLDAKPVEEITDVEKLYLRNAFFYRADCAFDLKQYDEAIGLYDKASQRFEQDPASLIALVQIVNAYCEQGKIEEARVANDRARWQFKNIPDSAFEDENLPMNRKHWEDWLRWSDELNLFDQQANVSKQAGG